VGALQTRNSEGEVLPGQNLQVAVYGVIPPTHVSAKVPAVPLASVAGPVAVATTSGRRLTAATSFGVAAESVMFRMTRLIANPVGGVGMVTEAPVASNMPLLREPKSQRKVRGRVHVRHEAVAVNVIGEPAISGFGEKLQEAVQANPKAEGSQKDWASKDADCEAWGTMDGLVT